MPVDGYWLALSAETAGLATLFSVAAGVPLAWILENRTFAGKSTASTVLNGAMALPAPLLCYLLVGHGWPLSCRGTVPMGVLSALPLLVRQMRGAFAHLSPAPAKAARTLGLPDSSIFARVELPVVWRAVGGATVWAVARLVLELSAAFWFLRRL